MLKYIPAPNTENESIYTIMHKKRRLSKVSLLHYCRLAYRSVLFLAALYWYILHQIHEETRISRLIDHIIDSPLLGIIWIVFMVEMVLRLIPSHWESPGCQKQFRRNYTPTGRTDVLLHDNNAIMITAICWIVPNAAFGALNQVGILNDGIMLLLCLFYSVCDMICILFFCPFQTWLLKNRCCASCRIYNWDYAMIFTPLFFVPSVYTWSLLAVAVIILLRWEITVWRYPERFSEHTNAYLTCSNCTEKLCVHKKQLRHFKVELEKLAKETTRRILRREEHGNH